MTSVADLYIKHAETAIVSLRMDGPWLGPHRLETFDPWEGFTYCRGLDRSGRKYKVAKGVESGS